MDIKSGFASVANGRLYYEFSAAGADIDSVIVFIHGNAGDRRHWDSQFKAFANQFSAMTSVGSGIHRYP